MIGGKYDADTVSRWLLDADQYKGELANVAKLIKKQEREEKSLETVRKGL